jgi:hypothetical protein
VYTWRESAEITSPLNRPAISTASDDFPVAVGPVITMRDCFFIILSLSYMWIICSGVLKNDIITIVRLISLITIK